MQRRVEVSPFFQGKPKFRQETQIKLIKMQIIREIPRNFYVYDVQTTLVYTFMLMRHNLGQFFVRNTEF
jgi:hypothetical protein